MAAHINCPVTHDGDHPGQGLGCERIEFPCRMPDRAEGIMQHFFRHFTPYYDPLRDTEQQRSTGFVEALKGIGGAFITTTDPLAVEPRE